MPVLRPFARPVEGDRVRSLDSPGYACALDKFALTLPFYPFTRAFHPPRISAVSNMHAFRISLDLLRLLRHHQRQGQFHDYEYRLAEHQHTGPAQRDYADGLYRSTLGHRGNHALYLEYYFWIPTPGAESEFFFGRHHRNTDHGRNFQFHGTG